MSESAAASYTAVQNIDIESVVTQHASLVKRIAYHLKGRLPDTVLVDDLIQSGMVGLLEAAKNFNPTQGASFETYAGIRIRGAMLDEIRRGDWTPRSVHRKSRDMMEAIRKVENRTLSSATDSEIALEMGEGDAQRMINFYLADSYNGLGDLEKLTCLAMKATWPC